MESFSGIWNCFGMQNSLIECFPTNKAVVLKIFAAPLVFIVHYCMLLY